MIMSTIHPAMVYPEETTKSYCGYCKEDFSSDIYTCLACGSNLINYDKEKTWEVFAMDNKWDRHNKNFNSADKEGNGNKR